MSLGCDNRVYACGSEGGTGVGGLKGFPRPALRVRAPKIPLGELKRRERMKKWDRGRTRKRKKF
jgi:hypothetical protein